MQLINGLMKGLVGAAICAFASIGFLIIIEHLVFDVQRGVDIAAWLVKTVFICGMIAGAFLFKATWVQILALVGAIFIIFMIFIIAGPSISWN